LTLTQTGTALSGNAGYPAGSPPPSYQYTFSLTSGSVVVDAITWTATYGSPGDPAAVGCTLNVTGTIAPDGTMSGTWTDNYPNQTGSRSGTWSTTSGHASPSLTVYGNVVAPTIAFNAPIGPVNLNNPAAVNGPMMEYGWNYGSATAGSIALYEGSSQAAVWTVTALDGGTGLMTTGTNTLANYLLIGGGASANSGPWNIANGGTAMDQNPGGSTYTGTLTYSGNTPNAWVPINFNAAQYVTASDVAGSYTDTITFTASVAP
jgi:hypothetical protein